MKAYVALLPILAAATLLSSCEQQQSQIVALKEDFQRQIQDKDASIKEMKQRLTDLEASNKQLLERATDYGRLPQSVADSVGKTLEPISTNFTTLQSKVDSLVAKIDSLEKAQRTLAQAAATAPANTGGSQQPQGGYSGGGGQQQPQQPQQPSGGGIRQKDPGDNRVDGGRFNF